MEKKKWGSFVFFSTAGVPYPKQSDDWRHSGGDNFKAHSSKSQASRGH